MPTYEYRCPQCGNQFDKFQRMSEDPVAECPACGAEAERRLSAGAGLLFKGSGFYITDYRSEGYKKAAEGEKPAASSDKGDSSGKSETAGDKSSKPADSPASKSAGSAPKSE